MSEQTFKTEQEFHAARRMFLCLPDQTVMVAAGGDVRTHFEWLASLFGSEEAHSLIKTRTRGYVLGNRLVAYKGDDFSHWVDHAGVITALDLFDRMSGGKIEEVGLGAVYAKDVQPWPPRTVHPAKEYFANILKRYASKERHGALLPQAEGQPPDAPAEGA